MADFKPALDKTLDHEGRVLTNDSHDKGGETFYGISRKAFPDWNGWTWVDNGNIDGFPADWIAAFYRTEFWTPLRCDDMPQAIAEKLFDTAVNIGASRAVKILQAVVGVETDGIVGPYTLAAIKACNEQSTLDLFRNIQADYYLSVVSHDPTQERFINGWLARARS